MTSTCDASAFEHHILNSSLMLSSAFEPPFFDVEAVAFGFLMLLVELKATVVAFVATTLLLELVFTRADLPGCDTFALLLLVTVEGTFATVWLLTKVFPVPLSWVLFTFTADVDGLLDSSQKQLLFPLAVERKGLKFSTHVMGCHFSSFFTLCCFCWACGNSERKKM